LPKRPSLASQKASKTSSSYSSYHCYGVRARIVSSNAKLDHDDHATQAQTPTRPSSPVPPPPPGPLPTVYILYPSSTACRCVMVPTALQLPQAPCAKVALPVLRDCCRASFEKRVSRGVALMQFVTSICQLRLRFGGRATRVSVGLVAGCLRH
jgi:hypothetical protein